MQRPDTKQLRASKAYTKFVVCFASFVDALFYGLIVPVLPFALCDRIHVPDDQVQQWNSILLGTFSLAIAVTSGEKCSSFYTEHSVLRACGN